MFPSPTEPNIETRLFADYFQFYLQDDDIEKGNLEDAWTDAASHRQLAVAPFVLGVGTARNMEVPVRVFLGASPTNLDLAQYDLVNRAGLENETGRIVLAGCTDYFPDAIRFDVPIGYLDVVIGYGQLDSLSEDELDGNDFYDVFIVPTESSIKTETLKDTRTKRG